MNAVPITPCVRCPNCQNYVPISSDTHANGPTAHIMWPGVNPPIFNGALNPNQPPRIPPFGPMLGPLVMNPPDVSLSQYDESWLSRFWKIPVLIHSIVEIVLTILIFILEIATLAVSTYSATGAGIWCSIPFLTAGILTILLVTKWNRSRLWATRVCIAQIVLLVFCFILIGIVGNYVSVQQSLVSLYTTDSISASTFAVKYQIMQAQLAFAILLLFAGIAYIVYYCVVTYLALWKPFQTLDTPHLFRE